LNGEYRLRKIWIKKRRLFPFRHTGQFSDRYDQKQAIEAELQAIEAVPPLTGNDLSLLGELPHALGLLDRAPAHCRRSSSH
jgi:hypothetical protein